MNKEKKALIMSAGYGTRLEPLTLAVPKPMVPIVNLPTMQHNIELLKRYGFFDITANIHYHPEQIENYFGDGYAFGVKLGYSFEEELLGTAGGVKRMACLANVKEPFLVLSSDALTDINLERIFEYHCQKKALITIALSKVEDVSQFGVVIQDSEGQIIGFQEKPTQAEVQSDLVNAGVYVIDPSVLEMIPEGFYDFGKQLFPLLIGQKARIFGYRMLGYWSDVGCLDKYIQASYDAMKGLVKVGIPGNRAGSATWIGERENISPSARFEGSVIIGDSCVVGDNVYIKDSVIGDKCVVEAGAIITGSVIWSDTVIEKAAHLTCSVVASWCHIGARVKVQEGSVVANRSIVRPDTVLSLQTNLRPNSII
ncbi:hypothetical protein COT42_03000 [Candidatus Saganbacteria bacterium CG08_land_8_20_14_0_20_45_16]|uniref:Uncharacterized protein n=1 Tax=Candidatus Saganbacteria bacterium CG08_land_8_20_14_0_20_45_16 TaxID=2014293 RepID=A0A2H0XZB7_UNCSA|nr:MAG: hypothetical protein COT42_03000 [Candidatus Saganbacteria bacterium CG08_land_8_20_14_0_20_45_16]